MTIKEKKNVVIMTGNEEELKEYAAKKGLTKEPGICVITADLPEDGYYKEKIRRLEEERDSFSAENLRLRKIIEEKSADNKRLVDRTGKLEKALIEATIK